MSGLMRSGHTGEPQHQRFMEESRGHRERGLWVWMFTEHSQIKPWSQGGNKGLLSSLVDPSDHPTLSLCSPDHDQYHPWHFRLQGAWSTFMGERGPQSNWWCLDKAQSEKGGKWPSASFAIIHSSKVTMRKPTPEDILQKSKSTFTSRVKDTGNTARLSGCHRREEIQETEKLNIVQVLRLDTGTVEKEHEWKKW